MTMLLLTGLLLLSTLLQSLIGSQLPLFNGRPDLPLVVVVTWAMLRGPGEGAFAGFLGGLLLDSVSYTPFGVNGALLGILGYVTGLLETQFYRGNVVIFATTGLVVTLLFHTGRLLILQALGMTLPPLEAIYGVAAPAAVLNAVLLGPTFLLCRRAIRGLEGWRQIRV